MNSVDFPIRAHDPPGPSADEAVRRRAPACEYERAPGEAATRAPVGIFASAVCRAGAGLLVTAGMACTPPASIPVAAAPSNQPEPAIERPRRRPPGFTVPGSQVGVPARARAGSVVEGRAPAGSRVEAAGQVLEVDEDMRFRLQIPADARGTLPVRVVRPDGTVLVLRVEVDGD